MIKRLIVKGLFGELDYDLNFQEDLNILTGRNGSGKTTLMKLMWYILSGNFELIKNDIRFDSGSIETSEFKADINMEREKDGIKNLFYLDEEENKKPKELDIFLKKSKTVFMPTFRRIEGGFNIRKSDLDTELESIVDGLSSYSNDRKSMHELSLSHSVEDLSLMLNAYQADSLEKYSNWETEKLKQILENDNKLTKKQILKKIKEAIDGKASKEDDSVRQFNILTDTVDELFLKKKSILFSRKGSEKGVIVGSSKNIVNADLLSSGEKQILGFLVYNLFYENTIFFIDEPEISLHIDWQRILMSILQEQNSSNQLIIATHSPFIYSKFPDKEIRLDEKELQKA
ncbi:MAG: putative ATPase [Bacteroidia bacterium]|jgi:predicted ATPase